MLVHDLIRLMAAKQADKTALIVGSRPYSFREIDLASDRLAAALQRRGIERGDRVAAMLENTAELVVVMWAALKAGAVFLPIHWAAPAEKLGYILADAEASCLFAPARQHARVAAAVAEAPSVQTVVWVDGPPGAGFSLEAMLAGRQEAPADPGLIDQDLCLIIYTSGSTGRPKGVMMTHAAIHNNAIAIAAYLGNMPSDVVLCVLPICFNYGLAQILAGAHVGYTVVLERSFALPGETLRQMSAFGVTGLPAVPTMISALLQRVPFAGFDLSALRYITNAAAPLPPAHVMRLREALPQAAFFSMYGLTECTRVAYLDPAKIETKPGSVGRPVPNLDAHVVDEAGHRLGVGQVGELVVRGSGIMRGYWRRADATAQVLRNHPVTGERVLHTGDLFWTDEDGDLWFVARKDDVFKCRGEKVSPREVENVLHELDAIAESAVIGVPDPVDGTAIKAFIVPAAGFALTEQMVLRHCRERLEPHLVPKIIELCEELPKTESGKITRFALRAA